MPRSILTLAVVTARIPFCACSFVPLDSRQAFRFRLPIPQDGLILQCLLSLFFVAPGHAIRFSRKLVRSLSVIRCASRPRLVR
jgi:hypothetical protein